MEFPKLQQPATQRQTLEVFGGYNHNLRIGDGEFFDMCNLTSDFYPVLSPRGKRGRVERKRSVSDATGITANHGICLSVGESLYLPGDTSVALGLSDEPKTMVSMGAYVIILPDKKWVNVAAFEQGGEAGEAYGDIEALWQTTDTVGAGYTLCKSDGTELISSPKDNIPTVKPTDPADGAYWIDNSAVPPVLKRWNAETGMWIQDTNAYLKIFGKGLLEKFSEGDAVRITGLDRMYSATSEQLIHADTGSATIVSCGKSVPWFSQAGEAYDFIVVPGFADNAFFTYAPMSVQRTMPDMDLVIECGNRLWGCKYGVTDDGFINEIYCSKLGSFKNWNSFQGISTDSYVASIGADGPFTGAVSYLGRPIFFKENCMIEVYGSYPSAYQVQTTPCDGVQAGCEKSLALVNNVLFYKSRSGVCAFDGSLPVQMGQALGQQTYESAIAAGCGNKYYLSLSGGGEKQLFVYDAARGLWHREDDPGVLALCAYRSELYCLAEGQDALITMLGSGSPDSRSVEWMAQSGEIGLNLPDSKYISRLNLRLSVEPGAKVELYAQYDFSSQWEHLCTVTGTDLRSFSIPVRPKRCDHMKLKLEGTGPAKLYSLTKTIEQGSDIP